VKDFKTNVYALRYTLGHHPEPKKCFSGKKEIIAGRVTVELVLDHFQLCLRFIFFFGNT